MSEVEKLRVLIPHWMEHNNGHEKDCATWSTIAREGGQKEVADYIDAAITAMKQVNDLLGKALKEAGGAVEHHHHHSHD